MSKYEHEKIHIPKICDSPTDIIKKRNNFSLQSQILNDRKISSENISLFEKYAQEKITLFNKSKQEKQSLFPQLNKYPEINERTTSLFYVIQNPS
jgi:transcriptional regulator